MIMFHGTRAWLALAGVVGLGCVDHSLVVPQPEVQVASNGVWTQASKLKLDIVFMIDDSLSMQDKQDNLVRNFPRFMRVLEDAVPQGKGETLDAHIAVVSSDLGIAPGAGTEGCSTSGGDNGVFQATPRGACAGPRGRFIVTNAAGRNFDGDIGDVFSCIARLGTAGCGFEHQLGSLRRALGGDPAAPMPVENAGFLRPDARLGLVLITDEDDCSAPSGSDLFTDDPAAVAKYGPRDSYRCNQFGHLCGGAPPPSAAANGLVCEPNERASAGLVHVSDFVAFFSSLKGDPDLIRVAAITGPPQPYATEIAHTKEQGDVTRISPSCHTAAGDGAPAVRLAAFVGAFGERGVLDTICADDFGPAMEHIARSFVPEPKPCVGGRLFDRDLATPGVQADCNVTETRPRPDLPARDVTVPACDAATGSLPCWRTAPDGRCAADDTAVIVDRGSAVPPEGTRSHWSCRVCLTGDDGPACRR